MEIDLDSWLFYAYSLDRLSKRAVNGNALSFDKDDDDAMDFVTATANLRAHIFNIPQKSRFQVKCKRFIYIAYYAKWDHAYALLIYAAMAGNIIPAIATTNAIIAGIAVMKSFAVFRGESSTTKRVSVG